MKAEEYNTATFLYMMTQKAHLYVHAWLHQWHYINVLVHYCITMFFLRLP